MNFRQIEENILFSIYPFLNQINSVQSLSHVWLFVTPMDCSTPGFPVLHHLLKFAQIHVHWVSDTIQLSHPLLHPSPLAFNSSQHQALHIQWPKYWSFNFSISPSSEYSVLNSFMIDWFDLLAVQGTLKSLLQHLSLKASVLWCSAFFMVQLSHPYMTPGKTIALSGGGNGKPLQYSCLETPTNSMKRQKDYRYVCSCHSIMSDSLQPHGTLPGSSAPGILQGQEYWSG